MSVIAKPKDLNFQPCTRVGRNSTGVSPSGWMGSCGRPESGFSQLRQRNGTKVSHRDEFEMQKIRLAMLSAQCSRRVIMQGPRPIDLSKITSERLKRRLGVV